LGEKARKPAGTGAEVQDGGAGGQVQTLQQNSHIDQKRRRFVRLTERLGQLVIPVADSREVLLGGAIQVVDRCLLDEIGDVDR
jgi:hypothetical protein